MKTKNYLFVILISAIVFGSCRPYHEDIYEEIEPNETAFVIPLEKGTKEDQAQLKSIDYLENQKVVAKRVYTPTIWHQTGRRHWRGEWIPTVKVIKVDRAPVTREWTDASETGTDSRKQDIEVESMESIGFGIGITVTASIPEEWAAKFLYYYSGRSLDAVMDYNVRSYIQDLLTGEFGSRLLSKCQSERKNVFEIMKRQTTEYFADKGIRIDNIGAAGQFNYLDKAIQESINQKFTAEMKEDAAIKEKNAALTFAQAKSAIEAQKNLDADIRIKEALAIAIEEGKLTWPNQLVIGPDNADGLIGIIAGKQ